MLHFFTSDVVFVLSSGVVGVLHNSSNQFDNVWYNMRHVVNKYWMMVERYPNLKEEVGGSIPGCKISSLLDKNLPYGQLPPLLRLLHVRLLSIF